jgi:hypothetical protein
MSGGATLLVALTSLLLGQQTSAVEKPDAEVPVKGAYVSPKYGYSVKVPEGQEGYRLDAPAPQHGFGLFLDRNAEDYLCVNAEFDAVGLGSSR